MKKSHKKYYFIIGKVQQEELKNTSDGSLWILGYGYNAVLEWEKVRKSQGVENPSDLNFSKVFHGQNKDLNK